MSLARPLFWYAVAILATMTLYFAATASAKPHVYTTYATCYNLTGTMADGSNTRPRTVAHNFWPLGTKLYLTGRTFHGVRRFVVRDTGSALVDGHLDIWYGTPGGRYHSCSAWGKRTVQYKLGWKRPGGRKHA